MLYFKEHLEIDEKSKVREIITVFENTKLMQSKA